MALKKQSVMSLPILNNLLENRDIHLEDGQFLVAPKTYDKLLQVKIKLIDSYSFACAHACEKYNICYITIRALHICSINFNTINPQK
jgi:hypothetical protein